MNNTELAQPTMADFWHTVAIHTEDRSTARPIRHALSAYGLASLNDFADKIAESQISSVSDELMNASCRCLDIPRAIFVQGDVEELTRCIQIKSIRHNVAVLDEQINKVIARRDKYRDNAYELGAKLKKGNLSILLNDEVGS